MKVFIQNQMLSLLEGQEAVVDPYYVFLQRGSRMGEPGERSILSIAQLSEKLTRDVVISCTKKFANPDQMGRRWEVPIEATRTKNARKWWHVW